MVVLNVKKIFEEVRLLYNFEFEFKDEQIFVIESILEKKYIVGVFFIGFGKSVCFLLFFLIFD